EDQDQRDRDVGDLTGDVVARDVPALAPRDDREGGERREGGDDRRRDVQKVDRGRRVEALLADQLHEIRDRLQEAERAGAIRAVTELHAPEELPLDPGHVGEHAEQQVDDDRGLDQVDPPRLVHVDTSTWVPRPCACSAAIRATPLTSFLFTRARSSTEVPFELTRSFMPAVAPIFFASSADSSI